MPEATDIRCYCPLCGDRLAQGQALADHYVYKLEELAYIELAHKACAQAYNRTHNTTYWKV